MSTYLYNKELPVEAVRWFYNRASGHNSTWKPFRGADSINVEKAYRQIIKNPVGCENQKILVRGDMFEADVARKLCSPIFWAGTKRSVYPGKTDWCDTAIRRGTWFNKINWVPLELQLASLIETEHVSFVIPKMEESAGEKRKRKTFHKLVHGAYTVAWMANGEVYLVTRSSQPFGHAKLRGDLGSIPLHRGYREFADPLDRPPRITQLCFVVHGIGQQLASIRHECAKIRKKCLKCAEKHYPKLADSGQRLEFIPVNWRSSLHLNCSTLANITVSQMRPLRMYINNCFVDVLYYTTPLYRAEMMKSLSWELVRLFNIFLRHNPQFLEKGGKVSVLAHSLGTVIMHDILRCSNHKFELVNPEVLQNRVTPPPSPTTHLAHQIEQARSDLLNLEVELMRQISEESLPMNTEGKSTYLSNMRRPASWKPLPQLSNLFLIGSPLGLFISINSIPSTYNPQMSPGPSVSPAPSTQTPRSHRRRLRKTSPSGYSESEAVDLLECSAAMDLGQTDPEALIPYFACRRVYNIFHSYDPIAYRLEPLLLKHYSHVTPVVLPSLADIFQKKGHKHSNKRSSKALKKRSITEETLEDASDTHSVDTHQLDTQSLDSTFVTGFTQTNDDDMSESNTESSDEETRNSDSGTFNQKLCNRLSLDTNNQVYKQHKSRTFKLFSKLITRRSSHVTSLGPQLQPQLPEPQIEGARLRYRVDYEWQKSFSPLAVLGAHYSYWSSEELAFFILYRIFGSPEDYS